MQKLEFKDIKSWDAKEIDVKVAEMRRAMFDLRMQKSTSGIEKPHQLKMCKKNVAKLLTAKHAKGE